jgi:hypothetical protein
MLLCGSEWRIHLRGRAVRADISSFALPGGNRS